MPIDYSKWKDIEVSDDEDDTHPNIDTPSLFKWRHEARVQRMQEFEDKKKAAEKEKADASCQLSAMKKKLETTKDKSELEDLKKAMNDIEKQDKEARKKTEELQKEERLRPWNVDTISKDGFSKTKINKPLPRSKEVLTEEQREKKLKDFVEKNKEDLNKFGWLSKFDDSKAFMLEKPHLANEHSADYLVIQCLNLAMEEKFGAMEQVAHQCICIQYLLELSKQLDVDPRSCIASFFTKIQIADAEYKKAFQDELDAFKVRIRNRAKEKIKEQMEAEQEALKEAEEEERQERLGPGGLDPIEVLESLPESLKECFMSQDISKLQAAIASMPVEEAKHHMKRCVDSGLWKPAADDPDTNPEDGFRRQEVKDEEEDD